MNRTDEPNAEKDHNARSKAWREILAIYGVLIGALLWNWLA